MFGRVQVAEVAQINELWFEYAAAANDGDIERWISLWVDDGLQKPPDVPHQVGKEEVMLMPLK